jgi:hypothetical protein
MYPSAQNNRSSLLEWSVAILGAAASVSLAAQVHVALLDKERLQADYEEARRNVAVLVGSAKQGEEAFQKREIYLQKIEEQEARHAAFLSGLLELSKTDPDARSLVFRHKVGGDVVLPEARDVRSAPPNPAPSQPSPASSPAPSKSKSSGGGR